MLFLGGRFRLRNRVALQAGLSNPSGGRRAMSLPDLLQNSYYHAAQCAISTAVLRCSEKIPQAPMARIAALTPTTDRVASSTLSCRRTPCSCEPWAGGSSSNGINQTAAAEAHTSVLFAELGGATRNPDPRFGPDFAPRFASAHCSCLTPSVSSCFKSRTFDLKARTEPKDGGKTLYLSHTPSVELCANLACAPRRSVRMIAACGSANQVTLLKSVVTIFSSSSSARML